jgi:alkylhydroperoxidase family enzyme
MLPRPRIAEIVQMLGVVIRYELDLTPRSREIATLAVASATRSGFEWYAHTRLGAAAGLTGAEIEALAAGQPAPTFSAREHLIWRVVTALTGDGDLDDGLFAEARQALGEAGIVDLIALVGLYEFLARSLRVWRTPVPGDDPAG